MKEEQSLKFQSSPDEILAAKLMKKEVSDGS